MSRHQYQLTDATRFVLTDNVSKIAAEFDCDKSYWYQVLSNVTTDPFAPFRRLYAAAVRAKAPVHHWDEELHAVRTRYETPAPAVSDAECIVKQVTAGAATLKAFVEAISDGELTLGEKRRVDDAIHEQRKALELLETVVSFRTDLPIDIRRAARARRAA